MNKQLTRTVDTISRKMGCIGAIYAFAGLLCAAEPVKIILDTDMVGDYDDAGALAMLHAMADAGEAEILGVVACTPGSVSVSVIEIINRYYGRSDLPVGCTRAAKPRAPGAVPAGHACYHALRKSYSGWWKHDFSDDAPDAVGLYRRLLAFQPDGSVVICSVGPLTNMRDLLKSKPDDVSPLGGHDLVARKVRRWVAMACDWPKGKECNSSWDWRASKVALAEWPTEIVFADYPYGRRLWTGRMVAECAAKRSPIKDVYAFRLTPREKVVPDKSWDQLTGHPSWDQQAVLAAVRGIERYFGFQRGWHRMIGEEGFNEWTDDPSGRHLRLIEKIPRKEVAQVIDELMCRPPSCQQDK